MLVSHLGRSHLTIKNGWQYSFFLPVVQWSLGEFERDVGNISSKILIANNLMTIPADVSSHYLWGLLDELHVCVISHYLGLIRRYRAMTINQLFCLDLLFTAFKNKWNVGYEVFLCPFDNRASHFLCLWNRFEM